MINQESEEARSAEGVEVSGFLGEGTVVVVVDDVAVGTDDVEEEDPFRLLRSKTWRGIANCCRMAHAMARSPSR